MDSKNKTCPFEALKNLARLHLDSGSKWPTHSSGTYFITKTVCRPAGALLLSYALTQQFLQCTVTIGGMSTAIRLLERPEATELWDYQEELAKDQELRKQRDLAQRILDRIVAEEPTPNISIDDIFNESAVRIASIMEDNNQRINIARSIPSTTWTDLNKYWGSSTGKKK